MTKTKLPKISALRNIEYYDFQEALDRLYADSESSKKFEDDVFRTEIPLVKNGDSDKIAINSDKIAIKGLNSRETAIYRFIEENGSISNSQACQLLDLKAPTVRIIFRKMINKSVIQPIGENRNRKYILTK